MAWGQDVTLDLTDGSWGFPTSSKVVTATSYTNSDGYTITVEGSSGNGFRVYSNPDYFLFGKQGASITLPAFDFDVEKIEVGKGSGSASTACKMNVFVGDVAVSTETTGCQVNNTYEIDENHQAAGNVYKLKVTSAHNAQATYIKIYKKEVQLTGEKYELLNGTPTTIVEGDYIITCNSSSDKYAMSNDDSNNLKGKTDFAMDGNANIVTDDKTIIWHIAPQGDYWTIKSLDNNKYAAYAGSSDEATMTSTLDDNALWSYNGNNGFTNKANNANLYFNNGNFSFAQIGTPVFTLYRMPDKYYVAGSWTEWATGKIEMTKKADGTFTLENQELPAEAQFKIIKVVTSAEGAATIWCGGTADGENYWVTVDNHKDISLNVDGGKNFYMPIAGTWTFTVDPTGDTPKLTVDGDWPEWEYYLLGDFNEWAKVDSYKFSQVGETSKFTLNKPIQFKQKFKIKGFRGSEEKEFGAVSNGDFWVNAEYVGTELSLTSPGEKYYMNLSNKKPYWELEFDPVNMTLVLGNYLSDIAELPFEFDGGRGAIENTAGLTSSGLGTDYPNSPKLKFSSASNAVILHFDERPGILSFDIKGNPASGTSIVGKFVVQTSEDGENYTDLKEYTTLGNTVLNEEFDNLGENVRYIKWLYREKTSGNVALGNIVLTKYVEPFEFTISDKASDGEVCYATISALGEGNWKVKGDVVVSTVIVNSEGKLEYPVVAQADDVIPGDGAYLVKGAASTYTFIATGKEATITIGEGDNMLLSTGEGNIQTNAPTGETDNNKYYFYKLSLNKKSTPGSVGFYWGNSTGSAFNYTKGHQAYLAVPKDNALNVQGFSFDGTTGIAEVESAVTGNDEVYTISGMRVDGSNLSKGVYIVNGKKVIIK